jgi:hypothetical protein
MMLTFPPNPTVGDAYAEGGGSWVWNAKSVWERGYIPPPLELISIIPSAIIINTAGVVVMLTGTGFRISSEARFDGVALATTFLSDTQLTTVVPESAVVKTVAVTVTDGAETSNPLNFNYNEPSPASLRIDTITPNQTPRGGAPCPIVVRGAGYVDGCVLTWSTQGGDQAMTFISSTELHGFAPVHAYVAVADVFAKNHDSQLSNESNFWYT